MSGERFYLSSGVPRITLAKSATAEDQTLVIAPIGPAGPVGPQGPQGEPGPSGPKTEAGALALRVVRGKPSKSCEPDETLISAYCIGSATEMQSAPFIAPPRTARSR